MSERKLLFCECPITAYRNGKDGLCRKPAFYKWTPQDNPDHAQFMCKEHGELCAGNFTYELRKLGTIS